MSIKKRAKSARSFYFTLCNKVSNPSSHTNPFKPAKSHLSHRPLYIYLTWFQSKENGENISVADIDCCTDNGKFGKYAAALHQSDKNIFNEYSNIYEKQQTILPEPYPIV